MTFRSALFASALVLAACPATLTYAETITAFTGVVTASDPTQLGRISRDGTAQTWAGTKQFSGEVNPTTTYNYATYTFAASNFVGAQYVDVSAYDEVDSGATFLSAYANSYDPTNKEANWLGDAGNSADIFGTDAVDFQALLPVGDALVLVMNTTVAGTAAFGLPSDIVVNAYADDMYDEPVAATPEPGTLLTTMTGLLGAAGLMRRRFARS